MALRPSVSTSLPPEVLVAPAEERDATGFRKSAACIHATPTSPAMALRLGAEVPARRHRSGLGAENRTLTQSPGPKSGARAKHWVQPQETQNSCLLSTRTRTVPRLRWKPAPTSWRMPRYRPTPTGTARNMYNRIDSLHWSVRRNPGEIRLTDHKFNQLFSVSK